MDENNRREDEHPVNLFTLSNREMLGSSFAVLSIAVSVHGALAAVKWTTPSRAAIVKLDTPGCPLFSIDREHARSQGGVISYRESSTPSSFLFNVSLSTDSKTLYLNDHAILPLTNYHIPPRLTAVQVPASADAGAFVEALRSASPDVVRLEVDYDRLVVADPYGGPPYHNHEPSLRFRILGVNEPKTHIILNKKKQQVLHVTLKDQNEGTSDDPKRSYIITNLEVKGFEDSYSTEHQAIDERKAELCTRKSWSCPDKGMLEAQSRYHRFIWQDRFDDHGRIGSLRHAIVRRISEIARSTKQDPLTAALTVFVGVLSAAVAVFAGLKLLGGSNAMPEGSKADKPVRRVVKPPNESEESEDEDLAWLAEQSRQTGEVEMTVDEVSQLIDLVDDDEDDSMQRQS